MSLTETLSLGNVKAMFLQPVFPIGDCRHRDGQREPIDLAGAFRGFDADMPDREGCDERAFLAHVVAIIKVINRRCAVVEKCSLYAFQAKDLGMKIEVFLRVADTHRDMVMSF